MKIAALILLVLGCLTAALSKDKRAEQAQALIHKATELSDVASLGPVTLRAQVKFLAVKSGTIDAEYERTYLSPQQWRATFSSAEYNSVTTFANSQVAEWSDAPEKPLRVWQFERALAALSQFIVGDGVDYALVQQRLKEASDQKFPCIHIKSRRRLLMDCFYPDTGAFKRVQEGPWTFLYEDYTHLGKKLLPETINIMEGPRLVAVAKIQAIEVSGALDPKLLNPPAPAEVYPACLEGLGLPLGAGGGKPLKQPWPSSLGLPPGNEIISNDAVVEAVIGRDGRLHSIQVSQNISLLRDATYEMLRTWEYEPFKVCGHPVEMPVSFTIWFRKG